MARTALTALSVQKIKKPSSKSTRAERYDAIVPGFGCRVTAEGNRSWIFVYTSPTKLKRRRYTIGTVQLDKDAATGKPIADGVTTFDLEQARAEAQRLRDLVRKRKDPADEWEAEAAATTEAAKTEHQNGTTFRKIADAYKTRELPSKRRGDELSNIVDRLVEQWGDRPAASITNIDVEERILALVNSGKPEAARKLLEVIRQIFDWAMAHPSYRLERSPAERMKAMRLIGKKVKRKRILSDDELRAAWRAADRVGYPFGPFIKTLMLTALRRNEAAEASRSEFDVGRKLWTIPAERMKGEEGESGPHVVTLSAEMLKLFEKTPKFDGGDYLFTSGDGKEPISGFSKMKQRFDKLMLEELRKIAVSRNDAALLAKIVEIESVMAKLAKARGEDRKQFAIELKRVWYVLHDIRRSVRTHLSALPVPELVRELILAHAKPELHKIYDQWSYLDEKRQALDLWAHRLMNIIDPPTDNIVTLRA